MPKNFFKFRKLILQKLKAILFESERIISFFKPQYSLIILDTLFPHPISIFRNIEFKEYYRFFNSVKIYTTGSSLKSVHEQKTIKQIIKESKFPVEIFNHRKLLKSKLIYTIFLNNTFAFLPVIERNKIPFIFTLYPGGGFNLNDKETDKKLSRIFQSPFFRKVIVNQKITKEYLLSKKFCEEPQIEFIFGVVTSQLTSFVFQDKIKFGNNKGSIDICFVANKQMPAGIDKGYDLFIESMKIICSDFSNIRIHVVGPYNKQDYDINGLRNITFYGFIEQENLSKFFINKDIIISPNRPFVLAPGAFDGFPTGSCIEASLVGVAMFVSDTLNQNIYYKDNEDIVFIKNNPQDIAKKVTLYLNDISKLYILSEKAYKKTRKIYSFENQILPRIEILNDLIKQ